LRYLISKLDARMMARFRRSLPAENPAPDLPAATTPPKPRPNWLLRYSNDDLWTPMFCYLLPLPA
jgi:hypothetical protein